MERRYKRGFFVAIPMILITVSVVAGEFSFSGDVTAVSSYYWRGIHQFEGSALQGTSQIDYGLVSIGFWTSSVIFGDGTLMEMDPYLSLNIMKGSLFGSLGLTLYSYDFKQWNESGDHEVEINGSLGYSFLSFSGYYVPKQASTEHDPSRSNYWLELSGEMTKIGADWTVMLGYGTYSSRYLEVPKKEAVTNVTLSVTKLVTDNLIVGWNYIIQTEKELDNGLIISCSLTF